MKESELRRHATCSLCGKGIGHTRLPLFWVVKIERYGVDLHAVSRQTGLSIMLGSAALAGVMGPDEDMAKLIDGPITLTVCERCALKTSLPVAALAEGHS